METAHLEKQQAEPIDEATQAAVEEGIASARRGELVTLEEADANLEKRYQEWLKTQEKIAA